MQSSYMDQQPYSQQAFYQDSTGQSNQFKEQPRVFYLQPTNASQYQFTDVSDPFQSHQSQAQMFTYTLGPQQQTLLSPLSYVDSGMMDTQTVFSSSSNGMDGCFTPPSSAELPMIGSNGMFPMSAPLMTISPSSLQHFPHEFHQSPITSASEISPYINPQFQQEMDASTVKKRRLSEGIEEHGLANALTLAKPQEDAQCMRGVTAKKMRKGSNEESILVGYVDDASNSHSDTTTATTSSKASEGSISDGQCNLSLPLLRHLAAGSKKKNPPPGGFKPWNTSPASSHLPSGSECINPVTGEVSLPNLENLTKEEIRKVKNRASAQRSRTRKSEQTYELRMENAKLLERMELVKQALKQARPDLCESLALDKPEPTLLSYDNGLAGRCDGMFNEDEERAHMQMLIQGLRTQLDSERNQRVAAEQKVSRLQRELDSGSPILVKSSSSPIVTASPNDCPISPKLTLDQVAERENAMRVVRMAGDLDDADMDDETLCSVPTSPIFNKSGCATKSAQSVTQTESGRQVASSGAVMVKREEQEEGSLEALSMRDEKGALMFVSSSRPLPAFRVRSDSCPSPMQVMLVAMALFALPTANRSCQTASCPPLSSLEVKTPSNVEPTGILHSIQQSIIPSSTSKQNVTVTLLKPLTAAEDLVSSHKKAQSLQEAKSETELNQAFQHWLGESGAEAHEDHSTAPRGWIVVNADYADARGLDSFTGSADFWQQSESELLKTHPSMFTIMSQHDPIVNGPIPVDGAFPALFKLESGPWHKGPSPTLGPLIVEDPFADIDSASDLEDLYHHTRASSAFDDHSSTFMSSRRTSIHSHWHSDNMTMSRSASALPSTNATSSFEKSTAIKFAKIDVDVEIQTSVVFKTAHSKSDSPSLLDRTEAARLLTSGASYPQ
ncbi:hypothetical protein QFC22_002809 [Naganishia vaughanmartiniae]|uniref:Uncharacterized protein n=1 Tax=Naganishia vaughanmartiniae TaxID=1424756 RepID=A0ACC2XBV8_9TREE|nr:hypothetical protein QFC22_002809 [Naganishia vaughanmartiniae]